MTDNIFARAHSLHRPSPDQALPILLQDNASRDFFFPATVQEFAAALANLPADHRDGITHLWLRRMPTKPRDRTPLAEFICGSGVRVIVIYPWRVDGRRSLGRTKPSRQVVAQYLRFDATVTHAQGQWWVGFTAHALKRFYLEHLLCHEVGHHVDWYARRWSKANARQVEEFADQYAVQWGPRVITVDPGHHALPSIEQTSSREGKDGPK